MTEKRDKRRKIEIEDKRFRAEDGDALEPAEAPLEPKMMEYTDIAKLAQQGTAAPAGVSPEQATAPADDDADWQQQAGEYLELAQRAQAELENYRKRVLKDIEDARRFAVEGLLIDLFPSFDGLAQAIETYKEVQDGENPLLDGVRRTIRSLEAALKRHGIEKINDAPAPFDPALHHALNVEEDSEVLEETVAEIYVEGYRLGDTVLKPAMVRVLKPGGPRGNAGRG
jgi:molecular chaperone GrpE